MAGEKLLTYNNFISKTWDGTLSLSQLQSRSYKLALFTSASTNVTNLTTELFANLTGELATGNGYTTGGVALTGLNVTTPSAGQFLVRAANVQIQATGGSLVFRYAVIYDTASGVLVAYAPVSLSGGAAQDLTVTTNNYFIQTLSTDGFILYKANNA